MDIVLSITKNVEIQRKNIILPIGHFRVYFYFQQTANNLKFLFKFQKL